MTMESAEQRELMEKNPASVIGADITVNGNIEASYGLHIEGRVNGDVRCATLILGENGTIKGSIYADRVRLSGVVDGAVDSKDLAVEATARVTGDMIYERLRVASGGVVEGNMKHKPNEREGHETGNLKLVEPKDGAQKVVYID